MRLTKLELEVLELIKTNQNEEGHSDFLSTDALTKKVGGVVSSLEKKGMIYNSYSHMAKQDFKDIGEKPFKMWCLTRIAIQFVGLPKSWN